MHTAIASLYSHHMPRKQADLEQMNSIYRWVYWGLEKEQWHVEATQTMQGLLHPTDEAAPSNLILWLPKNAHQRVHPFCWGDSDRHEAARAPPAPGLLQTLPVLMPTKYWPEVSVWEHGPFDKRKTCPGISAPYTHWSGHITKHPWRTHTRTHTHTYFMHRYTYADTLHLSSHTLTQIHQQSQTQCHYSHSSTHRHSHRCLYT